MTTSDYISVISSMSDKRGNLLLDMLNEYNKIGLIEITLEEAKEYYEKIQKK